MGAPPGDGFTNFAEGGPPRSSLATAARTDGRARSLLIVVRLLLIFVYIYIYTYIYILIVVIFFSFQQPPFYLSEFWIVTFSFIRATLYRLIVSVAGVDLLRFCLLNSDCVVTRVVVEICISEFFFSYSEFFF